MHDKQRSGVVSLVITLFIMLIVTLVALSFATLMRREQRQALDRQLNTQAFYAAETGINDTLKALQQNPTAVGEINSCAAADQNRIRIGGNIPNRVLDAGARVEYTCVFVDQTPTELEYTVERDQVSVVPLNSSSGNFQTIRISWEDTSGGASFPAYNASTGSFTPLANWPTNRPGIIRGQLIPSNFPITRTDIVNNTFNFFAFPSTGSNTVTANSANNGGVIEGSCNTTNTPLDCEVVIDVASLGRANYVLNLRGVYDASRVIVRGYTTGSGGSPATISGAQVVIDSTGRAQDIVRRIKINAPIRPDIVYPPFTLQVGEDICKRLQVTPQETIVENITVDGQQLNNNLSCDPDQPN